MDYLRMLFELRDKYWALSEVARMASSPVFQAARSSTIRQKEMRGLFGGTVVCQRFHGKSARRTVSRACLFEERKISSQLDRCQENGSRFTVGRPEMQQHDLQEGEDCGHGHAGADNEERPRETLHGCAVNGAVHWPVYERHQRLADSEQGVHFACGTV